MKNPQIEKYSEVYFFQDLPESLIRSIYNIGIFRSYIPGKMIIHQSDPCQSAYMILHGDVNVVCLSYNGRQYVLSKLTQGDWFNAITCLNGVETNPASVIALTPVKLLIIAGNKFRKLNEEEPLFARKIIENISSRAVHLTKKLEKLALLSVAGRLAHFLLEHANEDGIIYWQCTQNDIANRIGSVAEVVGRNLRTFADEGIILIPRKNCIVIQDFEGLREKSLK